MAILAVPKIVEELFREPPPSDSVDGWLSTLLRDRHGVPDLLAAEQAEDLKPRVIREIERQMDEHRRRGIEPVLGWDSSTQSVHRVVKDGVTRADVRQCFPELDGDQFERVGAWMLTYYGAARSEAIGGGGDRKIDLVATFSAPPVAGRERLRSIPQRVVAQSKLRAGKVQVSTDEVESFAKSIEAIRQRGDILQRLPGWFIDDDLVVHGLLITGGSLTPDAKRAAARSGLFVLEGDQFAEDLALAEPALMWLDPELSFQPALFTAWVRSLPRSHEGRWKR